MRNRYYSPFPAASVMLIGLWCGIVVLLCTSTSLAVQFIPLAPGRIAWDVSADGTTIVGDTINSGFRWTTDYGFELVSGLVYATAVSSNGSRIGGGGGNDGNQPAIWTQNMGVQLIPGFTDSGAKSVRGISADGQVAVGYSTGTHQSFRWDAVTGLELFSNAYFGNVNSANAITDDGKVSVGNDGDSAYQWTHESGLSSLGTTGFDSTAWGVSADASVIVGNFGQQAFRWTQAGGMQGMGDLDGGGFKSAAWDITPDGSIIVGDGTTDRGTEAFIWTQSSGMKSLMGLLTASGIDLGGWQLRTARGISDDGCVIVGSGLNPQGLTEAWVIIVPEPPTLFLALVAVKIIIGHRRRRSVSHNRV